MADGKRREQWGHTSHVLAKLHNVNCTKREDLKEPWEFNPYGEKPEIIKEYLPISALRDIFRLEGKSKYDEPKPPC